MKIFFLLFNLLAFSQDDTAANPRAKSEHKLFILQISPSSKMGTLYFAGKKVADVNFYQQPQTIKLLKPNPTADTEVRLKINTTKP